MLVGFSFGKIIIIQSLSPSSSPPALAKSTAATTIQYQAERTPDICTPWMDLSSSSMVSMAGHSIKSPPIALLFIAFALVEEPFFLRSGLAICNFLGLEWTRVLFRSSIEFPPCSRVNLN